jgi:hypothetical protein
MTPASASFNLGLIRHQTLSEDSETTVACSMIVDQRSISCLSGLRLLNAAHRPFNRPVRSRLKPSSQCLVKSTLPLPTPIRPLSSLESPRNCVWYMPTVIQATWNPFLQSGEISTLSSVWPTAGWERREHCTVLIWLHSLLVCCLIVPDINLVQFDT